MLCTTVVVIYITLYIKKKFFRFVLLYVIAAVVKLSNSLTREGKSARVVCMKKKAKHTRFFFLLRPVNLFSIAEGSVCLPYYCFLFFVISTK